ncbi:MAG: S1C family serine protease, partial [Clostridium sp.]
YDEIFYEEDGNLEKFKKVKSPKKRNKLVLGVLVVAIVSFTGGIATNNIIGSMKDKGTSNLSYNNKESEDSEKPEITNNKEDSTVNDEVNKDGNKEKMPIEDIVKKLSPAVVTVSVKKQATRFEQGSEGVGTGFIVDENGTIVTNNHVIEGANDISIIFADGTEAKVNIVSISKEDDIAILKVVDNIKMPGVAKLASDDVINAGQEIITIGNPLGKNFSGTVTKGIVSAPSRKISSDGIEKDFIQIDAAINPGNSGGPLINLYGEVIGVNTAKQTGENVEGIGFSVPIKEVRKILNNPEQYSGKNNSNNTQNGSNSNQGEYYDYNDGNYGSAPNQNESDVTLGISVAQSEDGVYIKEVSPSSIAQVNGLKANDKIISFNNIKINSVNDLASLVSSLKKGDRVSIIIKRGNKQGRIDMEV